MEFVSDKIHQQHNCKCTQLLAQTQNLLLLDLNEREKGGTKILCKSRHEDFQLKVLRGKSHDSKKGRRMERKLNFLKTFYYCGLTKGTTMRHIEKVLSGLGE